MEGAQPHSGARISGDAQFPHFCRRAFRSAHLCLSARISNVLHLLERVDLPELLIQLATLAISETVDDLKSQATLRTRIFKHHLDFGHNRQSYNAVAHIPDHSSCGKSSVTNSTTTFGSWETPRRICSVGEASAAMCSMVFPFISVFSHFCIIQIYVFYVFAILSRWFLDRLLPKEEVEILSNSLETSLTKISTVGHNNKGGKLVDLGRRENGCLPKVGIFIHHVVKGCKIFCSSQLLKIKEKTINFGFQQRDRFIKINEQFHKLK
ncbi:uncharacterized protein LOC143775118 [Ranitomeya variabilis]|uniref:uncharacterized protein LOC143775118 n=1 Tax=Ranitomeya variabilis TaxID=490064 RepID=UPI004057C3BD